MQDQQDGGSGSGGDQTRRTFLSQAFIAAAVWVVPGVVGIGVPSLAAAQDGKDPKNPEPTRTSDRATPGASISCSPIVQGPSASPSASSRTTTTTTTTREGRERTTGTTGKTPDRFDIL